MKTPEQIFIPGTEPPAEPKVVEIDTALHAWLDAKDNQTGAAETTKVRHATLMSLMAEHKLERYPFLDKYGKRKAIVADKTPKAKVTNAPKLKKKSAAQERREEKAEETRKTEKENSVEVRRVSRASVESEIDPFAATRAQLES